MSVRHQKVRADAEGHAHSEPADGQTQAGEDRGNEFEAPLQGAHGIFENEPAQVGEDSDLLADVRRTEPEGLRGRSRVWT